MAVPTPPTVWVGDDEANTTAMDGVTLSTICVGVSGGVGVATGLCEKPVARRQNESGTREQRRAEGCMTRYPFIRNLHFGRKLTEIVRPLAHITRSGLPIESWLCPNDGQSGNCT